MAFARADSRSFKEDMTPRVSTIEYAKARTCSAQNGVRRVQNNDSVHAVRVVSQRAAFLQSLAGLHQASIHHMPLASDRQTKIGSCLRGTSTGTAL